MKLTTPIHYTLHKAVQSRTDDLKLGRYLRNVKSVGWDLCLAKQNGSATTIWAKIFIV